MFKTKLINIGAAVCTTMIVLGSAATARAEGFVSPFIGFNFSGDAGCPEITGCEDKNLNLGVGVGAMGNIFGVELEFGYADNFFGEVVGQSSNVMTLMGNVMLAPKFGPVRPYFLTGLGLIKSHGELTIAGLQETDNNDFGWDIGGGLMGFFSDHVGIRGDVRYFHSFQVLSILGLELEGEKLDFGRASAAVVFKF